MEHSARFGGTTGRALRGARVGLVLVLPWIVLPAVAADTVLRLGESRKLTLIADDRQTWDFRLETGREIEFGVKHTQGTLELELLDPSGKRRRLWVSEIAPPWACQPDRRSSYGWVTDGDGIWRVVVHAPSQPADYEIAWKSERPASARAEVAWRAEQLDDRVNLGLDSKREALLSGSTRAGVEPLTQIVDEAIEANRRRFAGEPRRFADYLDDLVYRVDGEVPAAYLQELGEEILQIRERELDPDDLCLAETLSNLSTLHYQRGQYASALALEQRSLAIKRRVLDPGNPEIAYSVRQITTILVKDGRCREVAPYVEVLSATEKLSLLEAAQSYQGLAEYQRCANDYDAAEQSFLRALDRYQQAVAEEGADPVLESDLVNGLAKLYIDVGDYATADFHQRRALKLLRELGRSDRLATGYLNLGEILRRQGNLTQAEQQFHAAARLAEEVYDEANPRMVFFHMNRGLLYEELGQFDRAEAYYLKSVPFMTRSAGAEFRYAENFKYLARLYHKQERFVEAAQIYRKTLELQLRIFGDEHPDVAVTEGDLAHVLTRGSADDEAEARRLVGHALQILSETRAYPLEFAGVLSLSAELKRRDGETKPALVDLARALDIVESERPRAGGSERSLAVSFGRNRPLFDRMVAWQIEAGNIVGALSTVERSRARVLIDQIAAAGVDLDEGIPEPRRSSLIAREARAKKELAWSRNRERQLLEAAGTKFAELPERRELETRRDRALAELQSVNEETRSASPIWRSIVSAGGGPVSLEALQRHLSDDSGLLLYQVGQAESFLFVIRPQPATVEVSKLVVGDRQGLHLGITPGNLTAARLRRALFGLEEEDRRQRPRNDVASVRDGTANRGIGGLSSAPVDGVVSALSRSRGFSAKTALALGALREVLVPDAVWHQVRGRSELVVVPDRALHRLPFEALVLRPGPDSAGTTFWIDEGPVVRYIASGTLLQELERRATTERSVDRPDVLTVSDPSFTGAFQTAGSGSQAGAVLELPRLPGTARESAAIVAAFDRDSAHPRVQRLQRAEATEHQVRAALTGKRYVHLATHGLVDMRRSELFAALALTAPASIKSTESDGLLQLFEIYDLKVDAELVVLSACDSNLGPLVEGEGLFALSRGFFAAGARRVVASLWPVADQSTATLMSAFFVSVATAEANGKAPDHAALFFRAKRELRAAQKHAEPFFWAPLVMMGTR